MALTQEQKEARIDFAMEVYARTLSTRRTEFAIMEKFKLKRRAARYVIEHMRARWAEEAPLEGDATTRRNEYREAGKNAYEKAMRRRVVVHDAGGLPSYYPAAISDGAGGLVPHPRAGELVTREEPDLKTAVRSLEFLSKLDGLTSVTMHVNAPGLVDALDGVDLDDDQDDVAPSLPH